MVSPRAGWAVLILAWAALTLPYIAVGTDDFEEYFTAATTTKLAVDAMRHGAWPLWSLDLGLGAPQPLRFHFITHPLAPLCGVADCHLVLRLVAALHVLLGAAGMMLLAVRFTGHRLLALAAGITYCASSSVVQPLFTDDWPITAVNEAALPALLYLAFELGDAADRRTAALWTLALGGLAGMLLSMSFPVVTLATVAIVSLCAPRVRRRLPWLVLAAVITILIGAGQVFHLYSEFALTPPNIARQDHPEPDFLLLLWSTFARPLPLPLARLDQSYWRTVFFGPPFAMAALLALMPRRVRDTNPPETVPLAERPGPLVSIQDRGSQSQRGVGGGFARRDLLPLRVGLLVGLIGFLVPPRYLLSLNTAQWLYRTEINVFGTLLAVCWIARWCATHSQRRTAMIVAIQIALVLGAVAPVVIPTARRALGLAPPSEFAIVSPGIADEIAALHARAPGRVAFAPMAHAALRDSALNRHGLAPNQLPQMGIPSLSSVQYGITSDAIYPTTHTLEGETAVGPVAMRSSALLDTLGIRYVVAMASDEVAPDLRKVRQWPRDLRLYVNDDAWPEAFFVTSIPGPLSRLERCGHDRLLCADFSQAGMMPSSQPVEVTRHHDGLRLTFSPADRERQMVVTQWFREGWRVTEGRASLVPAAEDLIGVRVPAGESAVEIRFHPRARMLLFAITLAIELAVVVGIVALVGLRWRHS